MANPSTIMNVRLIRETNAARLLEFVDEDVEHWVPKSEKVTIEFDADEEGGEAEIANWFLEQKDLL